MPNLTAPQVLTTTRSVRRRLDFTRDVPLKLIYHCIEVALQAPSGSNAQGWQFVVLTDPVKKLAIADLYRQSWQIYAGQAAGAAQGQTVQSTQDKVRGSADYLALHLQDAPVWLIPCIDGRTDGAPAWAQSGFFGSILPAAWSFMLAARVHGLASCWTTLHLRYEAEAARILGIPFESVTQAALIPVAYPLGDEFKPAPRNPVRDVIHMNGWGVRIAE